MKIKMKMPDVGTTVEEMMIVKWLVDIGQSVQRGQPLLEVETDKATVQVESYVTGILKEICIPADEEAVVGDVIAVLDIESFDNEKGIS